MKCLKFAAILMSLLFDILEWHGRWKQNYMLDKYQHFTKVSKTEGCSFYNAEDRTTMQNVMLKRLQQRCTWDELLTNPSLQFLSKAKFAPKMVQIFKKKGYYFMVYEKPKGPPLSEPELIGKVPIQKFYPLFFDLVQACMEIREHNPQAYVLPEWVFMNRNSCKIAHFQPFFPPQGSDSNKHVFMYNLEKSRMTSGRNNLADSDILSFEKKQSLTFNLGAIAYQLLTGKKATDASSEEQYVSQLRELESIAQKKLERITEDDKFSEMVAKMIKQDPFDCPTLIQIYNIAKRRSKQYEPKDHSNPIVEVDLEKIQLTDKYNTHNATKRKKFFRPCCKTVENQEMDVEFEKHGHLTMAYVKREHTRNRSFLPEIVTPKGPRYHSRDTFTTKPTMLRSDGDLRMRNLL